MARTFGEIPGQPEGTTYIDRRAAAVVHPPLQHGISGSGREGADSIVVSGGYEDDEDFGDLIIYSGAGGRDPATGAQVADQQLEAQNLGLALRARTGYRYGLSEAPVVRRRSRRGRVTGTTCSTPSLGTGTSAAAPGSSTTTRPCVRN